MKATVARELDEKCIIAIEVEGAARIEHQENSTSVDESNQSYQHILWRTDKYTPIEEYNLTTVTYETSSDPCIAVRKLYENTCLEYTRKLYELNSTLMIW